jgi:hypothetical protein
VVGKKPRACPEARWNAVISHLGVGRWRGARAIEVEFVDAAVRLVRDYFWPHSRAALRQIGLNERHASARRLLRRDISLKDARRDALGQSLDADETQVLLNGLAKAGWFRRGHHSDGRPLKASMGGQPVAFRFQRACQLFDGRLEELDGIKKGGALYGLMFALRRSLYSSNRRRFDSRSERIF